MCVECCRWADTEWSKRDQARMKQLFRGTAVERDLATAYHVVVGITALGKDGEDTAVR